MVVLSRQYAEKYMLFLQFSAGGLHDWGILLVIPLEFQEIKHQPFSMTQPPFSAGEPHGRDNLFLGGKSLTSGPHRVAGSANRYFSRGLLTRGPHSVAAERHYGYLIVILRKISTDYYGGIFWKRPLPLPGVSARIVREIRFCNENNIPAI